MSVAYLLQYFDMITMTIIVRWLENDDFVNKKSTEWQLVLKVHSVVLDPVHTCAKACSPRPILLIIVNKYLLRNTDVDVRIRMIS